ncbi:MAG: PAS domain S-box protein [Potamolinea sp.]
MENALQESESKFRRLFESNIIGVIFANVSGAITEANDAFLGMIGYTRQEFQQGALRWDDITPVGVYANGKAGDRTYSNLWVLYALRKGIHP